MRHRIVPQHGRRTGVGLWEENPLHSHSLERIMEVEVDGPLEDHFPLQTGCFPLPC